MNEKLLNKRLRAGEKLVNTYREHYIVYWWQWLLSICLIVLPFFFMYPLFSYGGAGAAVFFMSVAAGLFIGLRAFFLFNNNVFIATDARILGNLRSGLFHKSVTEADFDDVAEISYNKKGLFATIFDYGDISIRTKDQGPEYRIRRIKRPDRIREELQYQLKRKREQNA